MKLCVLICFILIWVVDISIVYADSENSNGDNAYNVTITWGDMKYSYKGEALGAITLSDRNISMKNETTKQLEVKNIGTNSVTWNSLNSEIASVDATGLITAQGGGLTTIQAIVNQGMEKEEILECEVNVTSKKGIALSKTGVILYVDSKDNNNVYNSTIVELKGKSVDGNENANKATWISKDNSLATVVSNIEDENIESGTICAQTLEITSMFASCVYMPQFDSNCVYVSYDEWENGYLTYKCID